MKTNDVVKTSVSEVFSEIARYAHDDTINDAFIRMELNIDIDAGKVDIKAKIGTGKQTIALLLIFAYSKYSESISDLATFALNYTDIANHGKSILHSTYAYSIQFMSFLQSTVS